MMNVKDDGKRFGHHNQSLLILLSWCSAAASRVADQMICGRPPDNGSFFARLLLDIHKTGDDTTAKENFVINMGDQRAIPWEQIDLQAAFC